jgi:hypothetical protein
MGLVGMQQPGDQRQPGGHPGAGTADEHADPTPRFGSCVSYRRAIELQATRPAVAADQIGEPAWLGPDQAYRSPGQAWTSRLVPGGLDGADEASIEAATVAAYQASVDLGRPLSERKLAAKFGKTSRRWARHRMAEAGQARNRDPRQPGYGEPAAGPPPPSGSTVRKAASIP